jgi:uncharacterized membrane protein
MVKTIGNPVSWSAATLGSIWSHGSSIADELGGSHELAPPQVRKISMADVGEALRLGVRDFLEFRSDVIMIVFLYPIIGLTLSFFAFHQNLMHLIFPMFAGFALLGPLAAVGLYEMNRQCETGTKVSWLHAFSVIKSPNFGAVVVLGSYLFGIFLIWMFLAGWLFDLTLGPAIPASVSAFVSDVFTTSAGWTMLIVGMAVGFFFASLVLVISVISFPLLLDRHVGLPTAVAASARFAIANPGATAAWGLIVGGMLLLGSLPLLLGLIVVMPILGHGTWHLYRRAVEPI